MITAEAQQFKTTVFKLVGNMSDRKNRDVGNKREQIKNHPWCDCWMCQKGKDKLRRMKERELRKETFERSREVL